MDYKEAEIQDSLMGQKYEEAKATYQLLSYKASQPENYTITMKPILQWTHQQLGPSLSYETEPRVSVVSVQWSFRSLPFPLLCGSLT